MPSQKSEIDPIETQFVSHRADSIGAPPIKGTFPIPIAAEMALHLSGTAGRLTVCPARQVPSVAYSDRLSRSLQRSGMPNSERNQRLGLLS